MRAIALLRVRVRFDDRVCGRSGRPQATSEDASNVVGLKVSDTPFEAFEKYLLPGFDIFVGPEALVAEGLPPRRDRGRVGARVGVPRQGGCGCSVTL
jgi:hypothetical protein